jgi:hypothetical protein
MDGSDDLLRQHQQKMELHRKWMQEQHEALRGGNVTTPASSRSHPIASYYPDAARSEAQYSSNMYASAKSTQGGSSPAPYIPSQAAMLKSASRPGQQQSIPQQSTRSIPSTPRSPHAAADGYGSQQPFSVVRRGPQEAQRSDVIYNDEHFVTVHSGSPIAVFMRGSQWAKRREQRLEEQRLAKEKDQLADCTFSPCCDPIAPRQQQRDEEPSPDRGSQYSVSRRSHGNNVITDLAPGIHEHIERQHKARLIVREREERLMSAGTKWTPEPTQVEPFHLGQRIQSGSIKALHQPIQAPHRSLLELGNVYQPFTTSVSGSPQRGGGDSGDGVPPPGHFSRISGAAAYRTSN